MKVAIDNAKRGVGAIAPAIALVSASFWVAWIELIYSGEIFLTSEAPTSLQIIVNYALSTTALGVMLLVFGAMPRKVEPLLQNRWVVLGAGVLAALATLVTIMTGSVVATLLTGVFTSALAARFALLFAQVNPKAAMLAIISSQILASFIYGYVLALPASWRPCLLCLLPFIGAFCSLIDGGQLRYDVPGPMKGASREFLRLVCAIFMFAVAINIVRGFYPSTIEMDTFAEARGNSSVLFFFVKMGLACVVLFLPTRTNLGKLCYFGFVALAFLTLPLPLFGLGSSFILETFGCINALLNIVIWTLFAGIAYKSGRSPIRMFGWGWGALSFGSVIGWLIGFALFAFGVDASMMTVVEIAMLAVMLLSCVFVVTWQVVDKLFDPIDVDASDADGDRSIGAREPLAPAEAPEADALGAERGRRLADAPELAESAVSEGEPPEAKRGPGRWKRGAIDMAVTYELSAREADVLELLLKGYTKQHIAEELFIAYNTVRSHVRNIYAKCDAHSQQELISKFEAEHLAS